MKIVILGDSETLARCTGELLTQWGHSVTFVPIGDGPSVLAADTLLTADIIVVQQGITAVQTEQLIQVMTGTSSRLLVCSSYNVYLAYARWTKATPGNPELVPLLEDDPLDDSSSSTAIENLLRLSTLPTTIIRLPEIYGPDEPNECVSKYLNVIQTGAETIVLPQEVAEWRSAAIYAGDAAYAIGLAAKNSKAIGKIYNVADSFAFSQLDWVRAVARAADWSGQVTVSASVAADETKDYSQHLIVDSTAIRQDLGYTEQTPINEALRATVTCLRSQMSQLSSGAQ